MVSVARAVSVSVARRLWVWSGGVEGVWRAGAVGRPCLDARVEGKQRHWNRSSLGFAQLVEEVGVRERAYEIVSKCTRRSYHILRSNCVMMKDFELGDYVTTCRLGSSGMGLQSISGIDEGME